MELAKLDGALALQQSTQAVCRNAVLGLSPPTKSEIKVISNVNTSGPRIHLQSGVVVTNFIVQVPREQDLTIYGNGLKISNFYYVDDLVETM